MKKCDVLLICHDADRGDSKDGLPYSKIIGTLHELIESFGYKCAQFARPYSELVGEKAWGNPYSLDKYFKKLPYWNSDVNRNLRRFSRGRIKKEVILFEPIHVYQWLLFWTRPKLIISIEPPVELCRAAHRLKIPVIEPLHGFGYAEEIPWGYDERAKEELPTHIISFDQLSTTVFQPLSEKGLKILEMEHPWYSKTIRSQIDKEEQKDNWILEVRKKYRKVILVSLVWGYGDDYGAHEEFSGILTENHLIPQQVVDLIGETHEDIFWLIRRHPVQLHAEEYKYQLEFLDGLVENNPNCDWQKSSTSSLDSILPHVDGHLTMSSMTSYDAALFGIKTLTLCPTLLPGAVHDRRFMDLEKLNYAEKGTFDKEEIRAWAVNVKTRDGKSLIGEQTLGWQELVEESVKK